MSNDQITMNPEGTDFYRPTNRSKRNGLPGLVIRMSGGQITEKGANHILLGFAVIVFIVSIIIFVVAL